MMFPSSEPITSTVLTVDAVWTESEDDGTISKGRVIFLVKFAIAEESRSFVRQLSLRNDWQVAAQVYSPGMKA